MPGPWFIEWQRQNVPGYPNSYWGREANYQYDLNDEVIYNENNVSLTWRDGFETAQEAYRNAVYVRHYAADRVGPRARNFSWRIVHEDGTVAFFAPGSHDNEPGFDLLASFTPQTNTESEEGKISMIKTGIVREAGKLMLVVNAKEFHDELDKIGCTYTGDKYDHRPLANTGVCNNRFEMSTECLLVRQYPAKFDLSGVWTTPPSINQLKTLCASAEAAGRKILDHYQPIDISIEIQKKILK